MAQPQRGGEPLILPGGPLGDLAFQWSRDRYCHRWLFGDAPAISSVESTSAAVWPTSPPLQQIHQQTFGDGRKVIFGVGMAGRGHWSASITLVPDLKCWIVELACRSPVEPERLESTYELAGDWTEVSDDTFASQHGSYRLQLEAISPSSTAGLSQKLISIRPVAIGSGAVTTQWAFRLRVQ